MKRSLVASIVAAAVLALGACGSSSSKSNGAAGGTQAVTGGNSSSNTTSGSKSGASGSIGALCSAFSPSDVATLFGKDATTVQAPSAGLAKEQCVYQDKNRTANTPYWLFQTRHYTQPAVFDGTHQVYKNYENLSGIGDAAFIAPDTLGTGWVIQVKKGNDVYTFDLNASNFGGAKPNVPKDQFVALVRSKLG